MCLASLRAQAQRIEDAQRHYHDFFTYQQNNNMEAGYESLWKCYTVYSDILERTSRGDSDNRKAKDGLLQIHPYLQNGAAYYSNRHLSASALKFAQAFVDIPMMEQMRGETFQKTPDYATMVYFAASGTYNAKDYARAVRYFKAYLQTGEEKHRKPVYLYMGQAYLNLGQYDQAMDTFREASAKYPSYMDLLKLAINTCLDHGDNDNMQRYLTLALRVEPQNQAILNIQGLLYENNFDFERALEVYNKLRRTSPRSLPIARHVALNYYNLGVVNYNKATTEKVESIARKYSNDSKDYFYAAVDVLREVLASDPNSVKYSQALATAYSCLGDTRNLEETNATVYALGGRTVESGSVPSLITDASSDDADDELAAARQRAASDKPLLFSEFAKEYVESRINQWQEKDPYETLAEYRERVNVNTRDEKIKALKKEAERKYIQKYTQGVRFNNMVLRPYDAENNVFLVESQYGELVVPVPRENNEARIFESSWNSMRFRDPSFYISNDKLLLSALTFITPTGKSYEYKADQNLNYVETYVDVNFNPIDESLYAGSGNGGTVNRQRVVTSVGTSDVDKDIPRSGLRRERSFAVIISNENYSLVPHVPMALNDGKVFGKYCVEALGLPESNVNVYTDATFGTMLRAVKDIREIADAMDGDVDILFYYAGHGIPNEKTKDAYLLPVDADGRQTEGCYSLDRLYKELGSTNANSIVVMLDACFSGAVRGESNQMLSPSARVVALVPRVGEPQGNMVVFSAVSKDETALPYAEKFHGMFTYYLLKKLQESGGEVRLGELASYLSSEVRRQSVIVNHKPQTPTVNPSVRVRDNWKDLKFGGR